MRGTFRAALTRAWSGKRYRSNRKRGFRNIERRQWFLGRLTGLISSYVYLPTLSDNLAPMWRHDLRECVVVDCSRVRTPRELCQRFRELLPVMVVPEEETVGALAQALRRSRAIHLTPRFELHGVEALEAHGHSDVVSALETLGRELEAENAEARLSVMREGPPPRGRMFQHDALRSLELQGCVVEAARCWPGSTGRANGCSILWIKPEGRHWQRFFLDAGLAFWEEWDDQTNLSEFAELDDEMQELASLPGLVLGEIEAAAFGDASSALRIALGGDGALWLLPIDPRNLESDALLIITLPKR